MTNEERLRTALAATGFADLACDEPEHCGKPSWHGQKCAPCMAYEALHGEPLPMPPTTAHACGCEHHGILTTCPIHATEASPFNIHPAGHLSHVEKPKL